MGTMKSIRNTYSCVDDKGNSLDMYRKMVCLMIADGRAGGLYRQEDVIDMIKRTNGGKLPASYKSLYISAMHIERSYDSGYTKSEILDEYDLYAEKEEKERVKKDGLYFSGLHDPDSEDDFDIGLRIIPQKCENGSILIGRLASKNTKKNSEFDIKIPSPKTIEDYFYTEHDESLGSRKVPYKNTHSGRKCPICHRYTKRGEYLGHISAAIKQFDWIFPSHPSTDIRMCSDCSEFFGGIIDSGRYWCFECGKIESFSDRAKCSYSKMIKPLYRKYIKIKETDRKNLDKWNKERIIENEWGIDIRR